MFHPGCHLIKAIKVSQATDTHGGGEMCGDQLAAMISLIYFHTYDTYVMLLFVKRGVGQTVIYRNEKIHKRPVYKDDIYNIYIRISHPSSDFMVSLRQQLFGVSATRH